MQTNEGWFDTRSYRLRSARQKKRLVKRAFEKKLVQLDEQRDALRDKEKALPWIPLEEPYQKGWKRSFVLRDDVKRCNNAAFYETLLEKINTVQYSKDKAFKIKKRRRRKRVYETSKQLLRTFDTWDWNSRWCKLTEEERLLFYREETWLPQHRITVVKYVYAEPWRFVLQVRPHMITKVKMVDCDLEGQIERLKNYIEKNHLWHKIYKMTTGRNQSKQRSWGNPLWHRCPLKNKPLHTILDEAKEESLINQSR